jgi:hypothetical protein
LLRLKSGFSWSAAQTLSNGVKKRKKSFTWILRCGHLKRKAGISWLKLKR